MKRQKDLLTGGGKGGGRWSSWRIISIRRWRQAIISLTPDVDGTGSGSLQIQFYLPSWKTIQWFLGSQLFFSHHGWPGSIGLHSEWLLPPSWTILRLGPVSQKLTVPPQIEKILFPASWISQVLQLLLLPLGSLCFSSGPQLPSGLHEKAPCAAREGVPWSLPHANPAPASCWGSISCWRPLWISHLPCFQG